MGEVAQFDVGLAAVDIGLLPPRLLLVLGDAAIRRRHRAARGVRILDRVGVEPTPRLRFQIRFVLHHVFPRWDRFVERRSHGGVPRVSVGEDVVEVRRGDAEANLRVVEIERHELAADVAAAEQVVPARFAVGGLDGGRIDRCLAAMTDVADALVAVGFHDRVDGRLGNQRTDERSVVGLVRVERGNGRGAGNTCVHGAVCAVRGHFGCGEGSGRRAGRRFVFAARRPAEKCGPECRDRHEPRRPREPTACVVAFARRSFRALRPLPRGPSARRRANWVVPRVLRHVPADGQVGGLTLPADGQVGGLTLPADGRRHPEAVDIRRQLLSL